MQYDPTLSPHPPPVGARSSRSTSSPSLPSSQRLVVIPSSSVTGHSVLVVLRSGRRVSDSSFERSLQSVDDVQYHS